MNSVSIIIIVLFLFLVASRRASSKEEKRAQIKKLGKEKAKEVSDANAGLGLLKTIVGFITLFVGMSIVFGSLNVAAQAIFIAVICTLGLGGILIIYISYGIGSVIFSIFGYFKDGTPQRIVYGRTEGISSALQDYASKAKLAGMSDRDIKDNLLLAGWSGNVIDRVLKESKEDSKIEY